MSSTNQHAAATLESKGSPLTVVSRPTPTPGPNEVLVDVKAVALNLIDCYMRDFGFMINSYPAVVGSDIGGTIVAVGSSVSFKPGTRVAAFAPTFFVQGVPDYGAFQARALIPAANVTPVPDSISFNEASLLGMSVVTAWSGWYTVGLPLQDTLYTPADKKGVLVWGGASSIGTGAIQSAKMLGFTVYTTASPKHHAYLKALGAKATFDYKDESAVAKIVQTAQGDGIDLSIAFDAAGQVRSCLDILKEFKKAGGGRTPQLATAVAMSDHTPTEDGVEVKFVAAPTDERPRTEFFAFVMNGWLKGKLETGAYRPSPAIKVVEGGLEGLNKGLDELKGGVSGTKLVVEV
ncbi:MAG: hypothetical protein L6R36_006391 [Xanthoria steineri]|nr:MAG: hypothetical protein L6R36_006391 [Xanthoria steineri]